MLTFSEYCLLEQKLMNDCLDEGVWELLGKMGPKPIPKEKMEKDVLKVNQLKDPKKIVDALNPSNPLHITMTAAKHDLLPRDAIESGAKDTRHHRSITNILQNRADQFATA